MPELAPAGQPGELLTGGVYGRIRHPRYVEILLAMAGYALIANYLATYVLLTLCVPVVYIVTLFEEKELLARFGDDYEQYRSRVPRFLPKTNPWT